jgi:putative GTP pyrophosphokinase
MAASRFTTPQKRLIRELVEHYENNREISSNFLEILRAHITNDKALKPYIHSVKSRTKDPSRLKDKLEGKLLDALAARKRFRIDKDNLFTKINDLAGFRILHLHGKQLEHIHAGLQDLFDRERYVLREKPFARTWDDESRDYFKAIGIKTEKSPSLYTSVHYVINSNSRVIATCEIQVRTLMEEVWGEVDHTINYPDPIPSVACSEQIKALARVTSSATRLVDSIFLSYGDHLKMREARLEGQKRRRAQAQKR